jgi:peptide-methionine (S)-S-oxide reductase
MKKLTLLLSALLGFMASACSSSPSGTTTVATNDIKSSAEMNTTGSYDTATFGGGCFWCIEAIFLELKGVKEVASGYSGGARENPTYEQVCSGATGHAEVVRVIYDPAVITYDDLLEVFWSIHDPTTLNRQGADVGTQYRSVVFYHNEQQRSLAEGYKSKLNTSGAFSDPVVTEISPMKNFYIAENYHQNYYNENSSQPYCSLVIRPKMEKFRKVFSERLKR